MMFKTATDPCFILIIYYKKLCKKLNTMLDKDSVSGN